MLLCKKGICLNLNFWIIPSFPHSAIVLSMKTQISVTKFFIFNTLKAAILLTVLSVLLMSQLLVWISSCFISLSLSLPWLGEKLKRIFYSLLFYPKVFCVYFFWALIVTGPMLGFSQEVSLDPIFSYFLSINPFFMQDS